MEKNEVEEGPRDGDAQCFSCDQDLSTPAKIQRQGMNYEFQQSKPMDLLREFLGDNDPVARIRCLIKILKILIRLAKVKSEKMFQYVRAEKYMREIIGLCLKPITAIATFVKSHLENIQFANVLPITYPDLLKKGFSKSFSNVHELVRDPMEKSAYKQWKMAPVNLSKGKPTIKCRKLPAIFPDVRNDSRSRFRQSAFSTNNFDRFMHLDDDGIENDIDDDSDELSLPSSTTGISTLNSDDKLRISSLEAQLAQLQTQLQFLMKNQSNINNNPLPDRLPSVITFSEPSPELPTVRAPPPPAPPLPPPDFLKTKRPSQPSEVKSALKEELCSKVGVPFEKSKITDETKGRPLLMEVLKDFKTVKLRKVERSPNGTPMRGVVESWPTFQKKKINQFDLDKENAENKIPTSVFEKNAATASVGEFIAMALHKKFASVNFPEDLNEMDEEDNNSSNAWEDDTMPHELQYQAGF